MTDAPEIEEPQPTAPGPLPAPVKVRALAGIIDLVPCDILLGVLAWRFAGTGIFVGLVLAAVVLGTFETRGGQTPGKRLMGLEVRYLDGTPCDLRAAIIRNGFRLLDWFPGIYMIGGFNIASNKRRQRLGDQAAGTSVYRVRDLVTTADAVAG